MELLQLFNQALLFIHVIAGFSALFMFWIPAFARKGGKIHNQVGRWYVRAMWIVLVTAGVLSIKNLFIGNYEAAAFLGFLTVVTMNPLWFGIAVLDNKKELSPRTRRLHFYQNVIVMTTGLLLLIFGIIVGPENGGVLMMIFGVLGLSNGGLVISVFKNTYQSQPWIIEHLTGMIVSGIAAHTAFLAFGGRELLGSFLTGHLMIIPWVAPTVIGVIAIKILKRRYAGKAKYQLDLSLEKRCLRTKGNESVLSDQKNNE